MFKFVKKGAFMLLVASLVMGVTSCKDDDPDYENVTPPVVEVAPSQITGVVSAMNGDAIKGATVKATTGGKDVTATIGGKLLYPESSLYEVLKKNYRDFRRFRK